MSEKTNYKEIKELNIQHLENAKSYAFIFILVFSIVTIISPLGILESFGDNALAAFLVMLILLFGSITVWLISTIALANVKE
ncbi:hypothetical protein [Bacillus sp. SM2101]|uniref:hypothetical protein n=1 Tax=Bacillus sp. SM2101 TaxID=2805366 RepID=UPI001BDE796C|nr:hypothetical protein [Bacillus sp. SM2101]